MRKVYLFGEINNERAEKFIAQMHELFEEGGEPITVFVNSCGGSVTDALAIYDVLQNAPCEIHTVGLGKVHSSAITVLLSAPRANRASYPNTEFMSHDISWKSDGPRAFLKDRVDQLERTVKQLLGVYTRDTDLSREQAQAIFFADMADHYFNAEEALAMGFISSIMTRESGRLRGAARVGLAAVEMAGVAVEEMTAVNSSQD
jgi:ATP-dependent Clp protease protease subunit